MSIHNGSFVLVLHGHIPWVLGHDRMAEDWLVEAVAETYIPLLNISHRLLREGLSPRYTLGFSPVLCEQLRAPRFPMVFRRYCAERASMALRDAREAEGHDPHRAALAGRWERFYQATHNAFVKRYGQDVIGAFRALQDAGHIELMACGATHGYLPLLREDVSIQAQVRLGCVNYRKHFDGWPRGFWMPECGYRPAGAWIPPVPRWSAHRERLPRKGVGEFLTEAGIRYTIVDSAQLEAADPVEVPKNSLFPHWLAGGDASGNRGRLALLARDNRMSQHIWRHEVGYPGNGAYLEFHKRHGLGGHRYWRITDTRLDIADKQPYDPDEALFSLAPRHAAAYADLVERSLCETREATGRAGSLTVAFDAELFGHWWFEGPQFLLHLRRALAQRPGITVMTAAGSLDPAEPFGTVALTEGSWGVGHGHSAWLNTDTEWAWERIHDAEREMVMVVRELAPRLQEPDLREVLSQAARELLQLQASDWTFMISNRVTRNLAEARIRQHHSDFFRLMRMAWVLAAGGDLQPHDRRYLEGCTAQNAGFPELDLRWWQDLDQPAPR